jgi:putative thioredoxin
MLIGKFYHASWCGTCEAVRPSVEATFQRFNIAMIDVDLDKQPELGDGITQLPTIMIMSDGVEVGHLSGEHPVSDLIDIIKEARLVSGSI